METTSPNMTDATIKQYLAKIGAKGGAKGGKSRSKKKLKAVRRNALIARTARVMKRAKKSAKPRSK
jgi:hypothetical protein